MKLFIMRHGESMATLDPTLYGRANPVDVPLSGWGHKQALDSGKALKRHLTDLDMQDRNPVIYYSTHHRIEQTKDALLQGLGEDISTIEIAEPLLVERDHGDFDGLNSEAQEALNEEIFNKLHSGTSEEKYITKMPNGESMKDVADRLDQFLEKVRENHDKDDIVIVVTHGGNCTSLEQKINNYDATWITPKFDVPGTGDIIEVDTDLIQPSESKTVIEGRKRPTHLPKDHKAYPHGEWQESHLLKPEYQINQLQ